MADGRCHVAGAMGEVEASLRPQGEGIKLARDYSLLDQGSLVALQRRRPEPVSEVS